MDRSRLITAEERALIALQEERETLVAPRRALNHVLATYQPEWAAGLYADHPNEGSALDVLDAHVRALPEEDRLAEIRRDVTLYERLHSDALLLMSELSVTPEAFDQLFRDAQQSLALNGDQEVVHGVIYSAVTASAARILRRVVVAQNKIEHIVNFVRTDGALPGDITRQYVDTDQMAVKDRPNANRHDRLAILGNGGKAPFDIVRGPHPSGTEICVESNRTYAASVYDGSERRIRVLNQGRLQLHITPPFPEIPVSYQVNIDTGDVEPPEDHTPDSSVKELTFDNGFAQLKLRHAWEVKPVYFMQSLQTIDYNGSPAIEAVDQFLSTRPEWRRQFEAMSTFYRLGQEIQRWLGDGGEETGLGMSQDKLDQIFRYAVRRQGHDDRHPEHFVYDFLGADPTEVE